MINSMNIKLLEGKNGKIPTRADEGSAGLDLYACLEKPIDIASGTCKLVGTGIAIELPFQTFGAIFPRSGLATKKGLRLANGTGIIDESYRGELIVPLFNDSKETQTIEPNERIAQLIVMPYEKPEMHSVEHLTSTSRGEGGFGHSGRK